MKAISDVRLLELTQQLATLLTQQKRRMVTAESCTGGWVAKACTDLAGSSAWFEGGVVSYSNDLKITLLGVSDHTLRRCGAVSEQVVREMANGALKQLGGDISVAISGIAGPAGGTESKPVGTICFAWADKFGIESKTYLFEGDRELIRLQSVFTALSGVIKKLEP